MVVANCNASCYWLHVHCASRLLHETQTLNLSRNVSKFYARQVVSDDREAKPKFAAKVRPALYYSEQQVYHSR